MKQSLSLINLNAMQIRNYLYRHGLPEEYGVYILLDYDKSLIYTRVMTDRGSFKVNGRLTTPISNFAKYVQQELYNFWG